MKPATVARDAIVAVGSDHHARPIGSDWVHFETLGLYTRVSTLSKQKGNEQALYIAELGTYIDCRQPGMKVTCVGLGADLPSAAKNAAAQWVLGVLPVLALWTRNVDDGLVSTNEIELETPTGPRVFDVLEGPIVGRGECEDGMDEPISPSKHLDLMRWQLQRRGLKDETHWIECYAVRMANRSLDATCRLDNQDWPPGQTLLIEDARTWPGSTPTMQSYRQFLLLRPQGQTLPEPKGPSWFQRFFTET